LATHPLLDGLAASPDILIHNFDIAGDRALIIRLNVEQRRKASFLDDRILGAGIDGGWANWTQAEPAAARAPAGDARFIFHVGHCGSTLISKLLEDASGVRSLREPAALRTLASVADDCAEGLALWSGDEFRHRLSLYLNVACAGDRTIIKATSWCGDLARHTGSPALFCYAKPDAYIATMLGGANNPIDLKLNAAIRLRRMRRLCAADVATLDSLSTGELAALSWACETATIAAVDETAPGRFHMIEFDDFLKSPAAGLAAAAAHLSLNAPADRVRASLSGPLMRTYSKDSSFNYSPQDRRELLGEYRTTHAGDLARGLDWLARAAKALPPVTAAMRRFS